MSGDREVSLTKDYVAKNMTFGPYCCVLCVLWMEPQELFFVMVGFPSLPLTHPEGDLVPSLSHRLA